MGNRMCAAGCRNPVEERLTRPQRLLRRSSDVDFKKLRRLILSRQLAPCFDALEEPHLATDLEDSFFAIEYRGARTEEEKYLEHAEEQKVIEAKIRIQRESQAIAQVMSFGRPRPHDEVLYPVPDLMQGVHDIPVLEDTPPRICNIRNRGSDVEFEEIMVMEAIWQSLQDSRSDRNQDS